MSIDAMCTRGDRPNVLLTLGAKEYGFMLYEAPSHMDRGAYGFCRSGSICLTAQEARTLADELHAAAGQAEDLERTYKEHESHDQEKNERRGRYSSSSVRR